MEKLSTNENQTEKQENYNEFLIYCLDYDSYSIFEEKLTMNDAITFEKNDIFYNTLNNIKLKMLNYHIPSDLNKSNFKNFKSFVIVFSLVKEAKFNILNEKINYLKKTVNTPNIFVVGIIP